MRCRNRTRKQHPRGTIIAFFLVLVAVLTTSVISSMALTSASGAQVAGLTLKRDQAYYAAEAGIQRAWWILQSNNNWRASRDTPLQGSIGNANYSVSAIGDWNAPILISSTGTIPSAGISVTITAACSPAVLVPAISLGN